MQSVVETNTARLGQRRSNCIDSSRRLSKAAAAAPLSCNISLRKEGAGDFSPSAGVRLTGRTHCLPVSLQLFWLCVCCPSLEIGYNNTLSSPLIKQDIIISHLFISLSGRPFCTLIFSSSLERPHVWNNNQSWTSQDQEKRNWTTITLFIDYYDKLSKDVSTEAGESSAEEETSQWWVNLSQIRLNTHTCDTMLDQRNSSLFSYRKPCHTRLSFLCLLSCCSRWCTPTVEWSVWPSLLWPLMTREAEHILYSLAIDTLLFMLFHSLVGQPLFSSSCSLCWKCRKGFTSNWNLVTGRQFLHIFHSHEWCCRPYVCQERISLYNRRCLVIRE